MPDRFDVVDISAWQVVHAEVLGKNPKVWVREPGGKSDRQRDWLFKPVVVPTSTAVRQGEDWAEKIASELAGLLGIPCAEVRLAVRDRRPGCISRNVVPEGWNRVLGSELLGTVVDGYRGAVLGDDGRERAIPGRPGHSIGTITSALSDCEPPDGGRPGDAVAVFAGYLLLDAWIANQDRHDQNWAVLRPVVGRARLRLAPSYDHASSLGFNLTDARREVVLRPGEMARYAERGKAHRFEHDPADKASIPTLVAVAREAMSRAGIEAERRLIDGLAAVDPDSVVDIVSAVPGLSDLAATFIVELLQVNRRRLLS